MLHADMSLARDIQRYFMALSGLLTKLLISVTQTNRLPHAVKIISFIGF